FAYDLDRPFAPDLNNLKKAGAAKQKLDSCKGDNYDRIILQDALAVMCVEAAGIAGIPVQIHVGLIWTANGPTRIPEIKELIPLFYNFSDTTFVILHGGYPRTDDLAYIAATMTNVRAEFNWVPLWVGKDFPGFMSRWIDMIPNDRILYGTDGSGFMTVVHDMVTREGLAEALELRINKGYLSEHIALQIAANILRNNAIDTYKLDLPKFFV
ncbi:MAG: amidohydrolase family protein, partial [Clostridiales bacterium]|nr:amidohydrolase family protein [Clostridiales bacterium]